jgi:hypothetical protein
MAMNRPSLEVSDIVVAPHADTKRNYVLEPFGPVLTDADAELESLGVDVRVKPENFDCEIVPQGQSFRVGDQPRIDVRIRYNGTDTICLVPMLQCSGRARYPRVKITIDGPPHGLSQRATPCCTFTKGLTEWDFRRIEPGAEFDPLERGLTDIELHGRFKEAGTYVVRFQYSTDEPDVRRWYISLVDGSVPASVSTLLRSVPRIVLQDSIAVHVIRESTGQGYD